MKSASRGQPFCYMDMHGDLQICGGMAIEYGKLVVKVTFGPFGFTYCGTVKNYNSIEESQGRSKIHFCCSFSQVSHQPIRQ